MKLREISLLLMISFSNYSFSVNLRTLSKMGWPVLHQMAQKKPTRKPLRPKLMEAQKFELAEAIKKEKRNRFLKTTALMSSGILLTTPLEIISLTMVSSPAFEYFSAESYGLFATWLTLQTIPSFLAFRSHQKSTEKICGLIFKLNNDSTEAFYKRPKSV